MSTAAPGDALTEAASVLWSLLHNGRDAEKNLTGGTRRFYEQVIGLFLAAPAVTSLVSHQLECAEPLGRVAAVLHARFGPDRIAFWDDLGEESQAAWLRDAQAVVVALTSTEHPDPAGDTPEPLQS